MAEHRTYSHPIHFRKKNLRLPRKFSGLVAHVCEELFSKPYGIVPSIGLGEAAFNHDIGSHYRDAPDKLYEEWRMQVLDSARSFIASREGEKPLRHESIENEAGTPLERRILAFFLLTDEEEFHRAKVFAGQKRANALAQVSMGYGI